MSIERKTILDRVEFSRDGSISVRLALVLEEDGVQESSRWHRVTVPADAVVVDYLADVSDHLGMMKYGPVSPEDTQKIEQCKAAFNLQAAAQE